MPNNQNVFIRPELEVYIQNTNEKMRVSARKCMKYLVSQKLEVVVDHHLQQRGWRADVRVLAFLR
eukprot:COSAG05_NODE_4171_length_1641_cov_72.164073_2_plen_65_part_00